MKYKFSLSLKIKGFVEWQLEHYHEDKRQLNEYKQSMMPTCTANYSGMSGGSGPSDPTGSATERILMSQYIQTTERSIAAVERTLSACDECTLRLIDLVYWRRTHTVVGAAIKCHIGKTAAYDRINGALCLLALEMGLVSAE